MADKWAVFDGEWYDNPFWMDALDRYQNLDRRTATKLCFDVRRLDAAMYEPPIYLLADAIVKHESQEDPDGRRYLSRLMMALIVHLHDLAGVDTTTK